MTTPQRPVAVVVGATSKWQADGSYTKVVYGGSIDDGGVPTAARWGVGGAIAQRFAAEGFHVFLTTRTAANAAPLKAEIEAHGGVASIVELDLASADSIARAFATVREEAGDPQVVVYNAGYYEGRTLEADKELFEYVPLEMFEVAQHVCSRGPFLVMQEVLPAMRRAGQGTILISNNKFALRGRRRRTGESVYYPRVMLRALAQLLTEEYSEFGVHVANVTIDGAIDSPGTRALPQMQERPELIMDVEAIAGEFWRLHVQPRSVWSHELQLTPHVSTPSY